MGVNVTQLLNEEIKVIVEGGDNIATKTELNAGLDLKANKVVGGVFNGMDLKAVAEKLNTDKQDVIADSGWQEISAKIGKAGTTMEGLPSFTDGYLKIRKIGNVVYVRFNLKLNTTLGGNTATSDFIVADIPVGYQPPSTDTYSILPIIITYGATGVSAESRTSTFIANMYSYQHLLYYRTNMEPFATIVNSIKGKYIQGFFSYTI